MGEEHAIMKKFKYVEVSEKELEDLVRQAPDAIEDGLSYVDHQKPTNRGPLDVLMVDSGGSLIVAELKIVEDDTMLVQGIDYYDDISMNIETLARAYSQFKINPEQDIRLFLIAPSFSVALIKRCRWIDIPVFLFSYRCIQPESSKEKIVVFNDVAIPSVPKIEKPYILEDRFDYITNTESRELAKKFVEEICSWDVTKISVAAIKYAISIRFSGTVLCYLSPRRKMFYIETNNPENKWTAFPISDENDLENIRILLKASIKKVK